MIRILLPALALPAALAALPGEPRPMKVRGSLHMTYEQQLAAPMGAQPDHLVHAFVATGTNRGSGTGDPLEGANARNVIYSDMVRGAGPQRGYSIKWVGADSLVDRIEGTVTVTVGADGRQQITGKGTYELVRGTGVYEGAKAKGTWTSRSTGPDGYVVEWLGDFTPGKGGQTAAR